MNKNTIQISIIVTIPTGTTTATATALAKGTMTASSIFGQGTTTIELTPMDIDPIVDVPCDMDIDMQVYPENMEIA